MIYHFDSLQIKSDCDGCENASTNSTSVLMNSNASKNKIILLLILLFWIFTLFIEEVRQVFGNKHHCKSLIDYYYFLKIFLNNFDNYTIAGKLWIYFDNGWNFYDLAGLGFYLLAFILSITSVFISNKDAAVQFFVASK